MLSIPRAAFGTILVILFTLSSAVTAVGQSDATSGVRQAGAPSDPASTAEAHPDVTFMQGMIHHHAQAVEMAALVPGRSADGRLRLIAERIDVSQRDEIAWMQQWLERRDAPVPDANMDHHGDDHGDDRGTDHADDRGSVHHGLSDDDLMPGMLTAAQMARLEEADGVAFDRLFLEYMIFHHEGALVMVDDLLASEGGGEAPEVFRFASDVAADQQAEIRRMQGLLDALSGG